MKYTAKKRFLLMALFLVLILFTAAACQNNSSPSLTTANQTSENNAPVSQPTTTNTTPSQAATSTTSPTTEAPLPLSSGEDIKPIPSPVTSANTPHTTRPQSDTPQTPNPENTQDNTSTTPKAPTTTQAPTPILAIKEITYRQDPESGEYLLLEEKSHAVKQGDPFAITPTAPEFYEIDSEKSTLSLASVKENDTLSVYFKCKTITVSFVGGEGATLNSGNASQTLRCGQTPTAPTFSRYGYRLLGYDQPLEPLYEDTTYTATWELILYTLTLYTTDHAIITEEGFVAREDVSGCFIKSFSVFDSFPLPTPQSEHYSFIAWNTSSDETGETLSEIAPQTEGDITLYAIFDVKLYAITFVEENGADYPSYYLPYNTVITSPTIPPEAQKAGYGLVWYEDKSFSHPYIFHRMPSENITLYGRWELDTGTGFLSWDLDDLTNETIDSKEELTTFIDYVYYYNLTEGVQFEVTYTDYKSVMQDIGEVAMQGDFRANGALGYGAGEHKKYKHENAKCYVELLVSTSYRDKEATLSAKPTTEKSYSYLQEIKEGRGERYQDFYIDRLPLAFAVTTTNQLQYVVEHGYRPLPEKNSPAERIYLAARALLNQILPENATDFEKVEAIFNYLVINVQYDNNAIDLVDSTNTPWAYYDAFFMEGVFDNQKAVCDGIAKAFSLLCNIEGIPCVEVIGDNHAWNRVKIDNIWYASDPTHGSLHITNLNHSIMDHGQFLMSDSEKAALNCTTKSYPHIQATTSYHYFANKTFTVNGKTQDYVIENTDELTTLLLYLVNTHTDLSDTVIDIAYTARFTPLSMALSSASRSLKRQGISFSYSTIVIEPTFGSSYKIIFE